MKTYKTKSGDKWDRLALDLLGSEMYKNRLLEANTQYIDYYILPAGLVLTIPEDIAETKSAGLPPWKVV